MSVRWPGAASRAIFSDDNYAELGLAERASRENSMQLPIELEGFDGLPILGPAPAGELKVGFLGSLMLNAFVSATTRRNMPGSDDQPRDVACGRH